MRTENWSISDYQDLKKKYKTAIGKNKIEFTFKHKTVTVDYAKYLLEYLSPKFEGIK